MRLPDATDQIRLAPVRALRAVFSGVGQLLLATDRLREEDARQDHESGEDQQEKRPSWDGRLSSSVRLISPSGMPAGSPLGAGSAPGGKSERTGRKSERAGGRKRERGEARQASPARKDRSGKAAKPTTRGGKNGAEVNHATGTTTGDAGSGRRSGRARHAAEPSRFRSLDLTGNVRMLTDQDIADLADDQFERGAVDTAPRPPTGQTQQPASGVLAVEAGVPSWPDAAPSWSSWSAGGTDTGAGPLMAELPISGYDGLSLASLRARLRHLGAAELRDLLAHERSHANREDVVTMFERRIAKLAEAAD